jgi:hypothetical protein
MVCIAAANAGATSQDLKTGFLVGATPRSQQLGLMIGAAAAAFAIGLTVQVLDNAHVDAATGLMELCGVRALAFAVGAYLPRARISLEEQLTGALGAGGYELLGVAAFVAMGVVLFVIGTKKRAEVEAPKT